MNKPKLVINQFPQTSLLNRIILFLFKCFPRRLFVFLPFQQHKIYQQTLLLKNQLMHSVQSSDTSSPVVKGYELGLADQAVLTSIINHQEALPEYVYRQRLADGDICYYLKVNGVVVNYNWISFTHCGTYCGFDKSMIFKKLIKNEAFTYDFYTYENHRKKGFGSLLKRFVIEDLYKREIKLIFSSVEPDNFNSLNIHFKLGYQFENVVQNFKILSWTFSLWANHSYKQKVLAWINEYRQVINIKPRKVDE